jgi:predicted kinase
MPKCYQLVGVPGSGKSTWVDNQEWKDDCAYISTDKHVEAYANLHNKVYNEVFADYMPAAVNLMAEEVVEARDAGRDIIWDQTSTTVASRLKKFKMLPNYEHIAVVFKTPERLELNKRLKDRANQTGKVIPQSVVTMMIECWEEPTEEEGFTQIWYAI